MAVYVPTGHPAAEILSREGYPVMERGVDKAPPSAAVRMGLVNLMPLKFRTELQFCRVLSLGAEDVVLHFLHLPAQASRHTDPRHLRVFYQDFEQTRESLDGLIVTGAPLEKIPFDSVVYWADLESLFVWTASRNLPSLFICWAAQAALYSRYGLPKAAFSEKRFGLYPHKVCRPSGLLVGMGDDFIVPVSRHTQTDPAALEATADLEILLREGGSAALLHQKGSPQYFFFNHLEYDRLSLGEEYWRDRKKGLPVKPPANYFPEGDLSREPFYPWQAAGNRFFGNFIRLVRRHSPLPPLFCESGPLGSAPPWGAAPKIAGAARSLRPTASRDKGGRRLRLGIAGLGVVGGSLVRLLAQKREDLFQKTGCLMEITAYSSRRMRSPAALGWPGALRFLPQAADLAAQKDVDVIVELMGGTDTAKDLLEAALREKKHIITANKALLAADGLRLVRLAEDKGVHFHFEASVAGAIPVLKIIRETLSSADISSIVGVLNGSCNFILDDMSHRGVRFEEALQQAQRLGFSEADPSLDVDGYDTAHKINILSTIAFSQNVLLDRMAIGGIRHLRPADFDLAVRHKCVIKLIGRGVRAGRGVDCSVAPMFVPQRHAFASLHGAENALSIVTESAQRLYLQGVGAGGFPTAQAVLSDIMDIAYGRFIHPFGRPARMIAPAAAATGGPSSERAFFVRGENRTAASEVFYAADAQAACRKASLEGLCQPVAFELFEEAA